MARRSSSGRTASGQQSAQRETSNVSPAAFEKFVKGADFPVSKDDLIEHMRSNHAPEDVLNIAEQFEDKDFASVAEVTKEFGRVKRGQEGEKEEE